MKKITLFKISHIQLKGSEEIYSKYTLPGDLDPLYEIFKPRFRTNAAANQWIKDFNEEQKGTTCEWPIEKAYTEREDIECEEEINGL